MFPAAFGFVLPKACVSAVISAWQVMIKALFLKKKNFIYLFGCAGS